MPRELPRDLRLEVSLSTALPNQHQRASRADAKTADLEGNGALKATLPAATRKLCIFISSIIVEDSSFHSHCAYI